MPVDSAFPLPALVDTQIHTCVSAWVRLARQRSRARVLALPEGLGAVSLLTVSIPAPRSWFLSTSPMKRGLDCRIHEVPHRGCVCGSGVRLCAGAGREKTPHPCSPWARSSSRSSSYSGSGSSRSRSRSSSYSSYSSRSSRHSSFSGSRSR